MRAGPIVIFHVTEQQVTEVARAVEVLGAQLVKVDDGFDPAPAASPTPPRPPADEPDPDEV